MKKLLFTFVLAIMFANTYAATTYYWVGGASASFATAANWNTTLGGGGAVRTTPATDDILIFDGNNVGSGVSATTVTVSVSLSSPYTQTIEALTVQNNNLSVSFASPGTTIALTLGGTSNVLNIAAGCTFDVGNNVLLIPNAASFTQSATLTAGSATVTLAAPNANIQAGQIVCCLGGLGYETVTSVSSTTLTLSSANNVLTSGSLSLTFYNTTLTSGTGTFKTRSSNVTPLTDCYWPFTVEYCATGAQTVQRGMYTNLTFSGDRGGAAFALTSGTINIANTLSTSGLSNYIWTATSGNVNFVGTTNQSVPSFTYFSLYNSVYKDNTLSAAGDITVNGSLALTANTIFSDAGYTITVPGNVTGAGTHYSPNPSGAGKISMTGSGKSFSALTSLGNFEINGGTSVSPISANSTTLQTGCTFTVTPTGYFSGGVKSIGTGGAGCNFAINGWCSTGLSGGLYGSTGSFNSTNTPSLTLGSASTVVYNATGAQTISPLNYANLSITNARTSTSVTFPSGVTGISGTLNLTGLTFTTGLINVNTSSTIIFNNPTGGQSIPSLGVNYNNLTLGNSSGTQTLAGACTVNNALALTAGGKLSLGAFDLTIGATGAINGASATSYVVTDGAGKLVQSVAANTDKLFPLGTSVSSYDPATIKATTATAFSTKVGISLTGTTSSGVVYNAKEWSLTPVVASSTIVSLTPSTDVSGSAPDFIGIYDGVSSYSNATVTPVGGTYSHTFTEFVSASPLLIVTGKTDAATGESMVANSNLSVLAKGNSLIVNGLQQGYYVSIYVVNGQKLQSFVANSSQYITTLTPGVYFVKIKTDSRVEVSKVIIH